MPRLWTDTGSAGRAVSDDILSCRYGRRHCPPSNTFTCTDADSAARTSRYSSPNVHSYTRCNGHAHGHDRPHALAETDTHSDPDADSDSSSNPYSNRDSQSDAHIYSHSDTDAESDSGPCSFRR